MKGILFIVNPKAGTRSKKPVVEMIHSLAVRAFPSYKIVLTEYHGHAAEIAKNAIIEGYETIVVCGGDGTVNEVASQLCNSATRLGILPAGSGNGFARSLKIPMNPENALHIVADNHCERFDMICLNGKHLFVGLAGLGFDAVVAKHFDESLARGLKEYARLVLREFFRRKSFECEVSLDDGSFQKKKLLMLNVSNTGQFGNEVYISPLSNPKDGKMEISLTNNFRSVQMPLFLWQVLRKKAHQSQHVQTYECQKVRIATTNTAAHIDGEPIELTGTLNFKVVPLSLSVLIPRL